jgi:hypothetical protein
LPLRARAAAIVADAGTGQNVTALTQPLSLLRLPGSPPRYDSLSGPPSFI